MGAFTSWTRVLLDSSTESEGAADDNLLLQTRLECEAMCNEWLACPTKFAQLQKPNSLQYQAKQPPPALKDARSAAVLAAKAAAARSKKAADEAKAAAARKKAADAAKAAAEKRNAQKVQTQRQQDMELQRKTEEAERGWRAAELQQARQDAELQQARQVQDARRQQARQDAERQQARQVQQQQQHQGEEPILSWRKDPGMEAANSELALLKRQLAEAQKRAEDLEAAESQRKQAALQRQLEESDRRADDMEAWLNDPNIRVADGDMDTHSQIGRGRDYSRNRDCSRNRDHSENRCSERRGRDHRRNRADRSHSRSPSIECHNHNDRTKRRDRRSRSRSHDNGRRQSHDDGRSRSNDENRPQYAYDGDGNRACDSRRQHSPAGKAKSRHDKAPHFTPPQELELKSLRARLARLQGEAEMEPTAERQGQISALMYKLKDLAARV